MLAQAARLPRDTSGLTRRRPDSAYRGSNPCLPANSLAFGFAHLAGRRFSAASQLASARRRLRLARCEWRRIPASPWPIFFWDYDFRSPSLTVSQYFSTSVVDHSPLGHINCPIDFQRFIQNRRVEPRRRVSRPFGTASDWAADYDWRKVDAKPNDLAPFITQITSVYSARSRFCCSRRPRSGRNVPPAPTAERHASVYVRT